MRRVAYQGEAGAYSEEAVLAAFGHAEMLPCATFAEAFEAVEAGRADGAVVPIASEAGLPVSGVLDGKVYVYDKDDQGG